MTLDLQTFRWDTKNWDYKKMFPHFHSFYFLNSKAEKELTGSSQERLKLNGSVSYLLPDEIIKATEASIVLLILFL